MKEELLVLAKAYPTISRTYELLVCVAGITANGEWRRIYPIPWETFLKYETKFKKKQWISYELRDNKPSDRRLESRKIKFDTIEVLHEESYKNIKAMLDEKLTTLEELESVDDKTTSLGVISPKILNFVWSDWDYYDKVKDKSTQTTLNGKKAVKIEFPDKKFQYIFKCNPRCPKEHRIMCEDWELGMLYLKMKWNHGPDVAPKKVREKFLIEIPKRKYVYFVMGTHNQYPNKWLIVSVLYPKRKDIAEIETKPLF